MIEQSLEFFNVNEDSIVSKTVRKSFRVPISERKHIQVTLKGKVYDITNISNFGIGILLNSQADFQIGEVVKDCRLNLFDEDIPNLTGKIIHYSEDISQQWYYGIRWLEPGTLESDKIINGVLKLKEKFLADDALNGNTNQ